MKLDEPQKKRLGVSFRSPGFRDYPKIIDPLSNSDESGFYIDEYEIGKDHWTEGYVTEYYAK